MSKYVVYVTNSLDQQNLPGLSYTSGRYGWTLEAENMDAALSAVVERSRAEGIYGADWSAKVDALDARGQPSRYGYAAAYVYLRDDPPSHMIAMGLPYTALSFGGIRA